jgi:hypothetical protein
MQRPIPERRPGHLHSDPDGEDSKLGPHDPLTARRTTPRSAYRSRRN